MILIFFGWINQSKSKCKNMGFGPTNSAHFLEREIIWLQKLSMQMKF